jgi:hypothetical protein
MGSPSKTEDGELISSYECAPETIESEFLLSKRQYHALTGRRQGGDVIAYHARQSFKPGEITPAEANRIGYELAERFTKGRFAFVVYTHTDRAHIHNHIIWNSTRLDCRKKFRNFKGSAFALRRCSDILCAEHGLSVIHNPKPSPGRDYARHMFGENRPQSFADRLRAAVDDALEKKPMSFEDFLELLRNENIFSGRRGRFMRLWLPEQKKPTRLDTLGENYTEDAIREYIDGRRSRGGKTPERSVRVQSFRSRTGRDPPREPRLLIDIEAKLRDGKGEGYRRWATVYNLKLMAKTLIYLQERGLDDYEVLKQKTAAASEKFHALSDKIHKLDGKLNTNAALQKHIVTYVKTRQTYDEYRKSGYSKAFRAAHESDIILHQAAKRAFDELGYGKNKKLPRVAELREEYAPLLDEKKKAYAEYRAARAEMRELFVAKNNVDRLLNITDDNSGREIKREAL